MKNLITVFVKIMCVFGFITVNLQAQTHCDTLVSINGKKIAVRSYTVSKKEVVAVQCSEHSIAELITPIKQVKGIIQNGLYVPMEEVFIGAYSSKNSVLVEEKGPDRVKTVRTEPKYSENSALVEEKGPPITSLSMGRILIGLTASTPGIGVSSLGLGNYSAGISNNAGIQISPEAQNLGGSEVTAINICPSIGYSPTNHILIGLSAGFDNFTIEDNNYSTITLNPFLRGYLPNKENFLPFAELGWHFISYKKNEAESENGSGIIGKVGTALFLHQYISLDVFCAYQYLWQNSVSPSGLFEINETFGQFGLGIGFSVFLK